MTEEKHLRNVLSLFSNIFVSFSGGKDSTLVLSEVSKITEVTAIFVDTGVEIPGVKEFAQSFCRKRNIKLVIIPAKKKFFDLYSGVFPDPTYKDCIYSLIGRNINKYIRQFPKPLLIRGGTARQSRLFYKSMVNSFFTYQKMSQVFICNPLVYFSPLEKRQELEKLELWEGYQKGFVRTACWCCPFQTAQQWRALKREFPELWKRMEDMVKTWTLPHFDNVAHVYQTRIDRYWKNKRIGFFD